MAANFECLIIVERARRPVGEVIHRHHCANETANSLRLRRNPEPFVQGPTFVRLEVAESDPAQLRWSDDGRDSFKRRVSAQGPDHGIDYQSGSKHPHSKGSAVHRHSGRSSLLSLWSCSRKMASALATNSSSVRGGNSKSFVRRRISMATSNLAASGNASTDARSC